MTKETEIHQDVQETLYEIGYLVVPTVAEEQLPGVVDELKAVLEKHKAIISKEGTPVLQPLSYEIQKFETAYFGWITFKASPEAVVLIKKDVDGMGKLLRLILIKTDEEVVIDPIVLAADPSDPTTETKTSPEELDKKIDTLATV